jgi:hydrogenase maturation protease
MTATTLVVGLGNPILGDDGVGWRVAERVLGRLDDPDVAVLCLSLGGLALMEHLVGYRRVMIVDAMATGAPAGTLHWLDAPDRGELGVQHTASVHDLSLASALAMGRELGLICRRKSAWWGWRRRRSSSSAKCSASRWIERFRRRPGWCWIGWPAMIGGRATTKKSQPTTTC